MEKFVSSIKANILHKIDGVYSINLTNFNECNVPWAGMVISYYACQFLPHDRPNVYCLWYLPIFQKLSISEYTPTWTKWAGNRWQKTRLGVKVNGMASWKLYTLPFYWLIVVLYSRDLNLLIQMKFISGRFAGQTTKKILSQKDHWLCSR